MLPAGCLVLSEGVLGEIGLGCRPVLEVSDSCLKNQADVFGPLYFT